MSLSKKAAVLAAITLLQGAPVFASGANNTIVENSPTNKVSTETNNTVGRISVKEEPPKSAEDIALSDLKNNSDEKKFGKITISDDLLAGVLKNRKKDSPEMVRVKSKLAEAIEAANGKDYEKTLIIINHLHTEHPESSTLLKWLGIYQNLSGDYVSSSETFNHLHTAFPLSFESINNDFVLAYYDVDNARHLGIDISDRVTPLKTLADKQLDVVLESTSRKSIFNTLCAYQEFMKNTNNGKKLKDSKEMDKLWKMIPTEKQTHLDNFYGFDIDELSPIYGNYYRRKDVLKAYADRQKQISDAKAKAAITETKEEPVPEAAPKVIPTN